MTNKGPKTRTLLLSAEGWQEVQGSDWIHEATPEEEAIYTRSIDCIDRSTGRPYWLVTVDLEKAPAEARERALKFDKVMHLGSQKEWSIEKMPEITMTNEQQQHARAIEEVLSVIGVPSGRCQGDTELQGRPCARGPMERH